MTENIVTKEILERYKDYVLNVKNINDEILEHRSKPYNCDNAGIAARCDMMRQRDFYENRIKAIGEKYPELSV